MDKILIAFTAWFAYHFVSQSIRQIRGVGPVAINDGRLKKRDYKVLLSPNAVSLLRQCSGHGDEILCAVDVGGTNVRVSLARCSDSPLSALECARFSSNDGKTLRAGLKEVADQVYDLLGGSSVNAGVLAGAGPVHGLRIGLTITNYKQSDRDIALSDLPQALFPSNRCSLLNDLEATAHGIASLDRHQELHHIFRRLWGPSEGSDSNCATSLRPGHYLILAVGTGFGVAALLEPLGVGVDGTSSAAYREVLPLEFGHVSLWSTGSATKEYDEEQRLFTWLDRRLYDGRCTCENEDLVSGRGISVLYEYYFTTLNPQEEMPVISPQEVMIRANEKSDEAAEKAAAMHYRLTMRTAKQLVVGFQCAGVLLAGDNAIANFSLLQRWLPDLRHEFELHARKEWLSNVDIFVQCSPLNINLVGAQSVANHL